MGPPGVEDQIWVETIKSRAMDTAVTHGSAHSTEVEEAPELVIGIDFGTTYTGVAYTSTEFGVKHDPTKPMTTSETQIFLNKVELVKEWPTIEGGSLDKTRTALAYNRATGEVVAWGSKVKDSHDTQVTHFKLGLEMHAKQHYDEYLGDSNWQHPSLPQKTPVQFTADFLDMLHKYLKDDFLSKTRYGKRFYSNLRFSYALTVPAIWSDKAKELTRQAALQAGIPDDRLTLITEPEAAAVYCAATCTEVDLNEGDRFLVCDAGGGTVVAPFLSITDDLISYVVQSQVPFIINECIGGTGGRYGAEYLNEAFKKLVRDKLVGYKPLLGRHKLDIRNVEEAMNMFEYRIKRRFNPFSDDFEKKWPVPIPGAKKDFPKINLKGGYLELDSEEIDRNVFRPLFEKILGLVQKQIDAAATLYDGIKTIFLVGGLGANLYLREYLTRNISGPTIPLKQSPNGLAAIALGSVLYSTGLKYVRERVLRRHYGIITKVDFEEGKHPPSLRIIDLDGKAKCRDVVHWFARKGEKIADRQTRTESYYALHTTSSFREPQVQHTLCLYACEDEKAPNYTNGSGFVLNCILTLDLKTLPAQAWRESEPEKGFHKIELEYDGKVYGSVKATYS